MRMNKPAACMSDSIALPPARLCIAITGHRESNAAFAANRAGIEAMLASVFGAADAVTARQSDAVGVTRLLSLLAHGADLIAVDQALSRGWEIVAPLPFGLDLNIAINADPENAGDAEALLAKQPVSDGALAKRATHIRDVASHARLFELAEEDAKVSRLFVDMLRAPEDALAARAFANGASDKVATAGRVMIEQSDLLVAIWDGVTPGGIGGTRHTISTAVNLGTPVIWINAAHPETLAILHAPEELFVLSAAISTTALGNIEKLFEIDIHHRTYRNTRSRKKRKGL